MDKYDRAIRYLTKYPHQIIDNWINPLGTPGGCLFNFCGPDGAGCGCLTQVRRDREINAATPSLTQRIRADERLPLSSCDITVEILPVFAMWQRRLDKYAFRKKTVTA